MAVGQMLTGLAAVVALVGGCSSAEPAPQAQDGTPSSGTPSSGTPSSGTPSSGTPSSGTPSSAPSADPEPAVRAVSVLGLAEQRHRGDRLRVGAVRERTAAYTSYDVTFRSRSTTRTGEESYTISGVLDVPRGEGPFPAVVLAHGYIDPAVYVRGQGMTRERGYLAARGYVALHVDYRNHAESDDDPRLQARLRLGYSADVLNAVKALRASSEVPADDDRVFFFGRSMGTGVVLKALAAEPGLVRAAALWASVSSLEAQNYDRFIRPDPDDAGLRSELARSHATPEEDPGFWRDNSSRPHFDRISEPVLLVHGRFDDTCPPRWATATRRALERAGVSTEMAWYDDGHAFGPAFTAAMDRTIRYFDRWSR